MRKWCKPIMERTIATTNYVLSQKIHTTIMKGNALIEGEIENMKLQIIKERQKAQREAKGDTCLERRKVSMPAPN